MLLLVVVSSRSGSQASPLSAQTRCLHMLHKGGRYRPMLEHMLQPLRSLPDSLTPGTDAPRSHILGPDLCGLAGRHCGRRANADLDPPMARLRLWNSTKWASINGIKAIWRSVILFPPFAWGRAPCFLVADFHLVFPSTGSHTTTACQPPAMHLATGLGLPWS